MEGSDLADGPHPNPLLAVTVSDGCPRPDGPAPALPRVPISPRSPSPHSFHDQLEPSNNLPPGPYPPQVGRYTRQTMQALLRKRDLEERGILVYIEDAIRAIKRWLGFARDEMEERHVDDDYASEVEENDGHYDAWSDSDASSTVSA